jgi:diguanylate cyclase (GGDEF)-like protein
LLIEPSASDAESIESLIATGMGRLDLVHSPTLADAFDQVLTQQFDAILLSLDSEGTDTVRRALERTRAPIIVLTSGADDLKGMQALQAGADDYLIKLHLDRDNLRRALQCAIARNSWRNEIYALCLRDDLTGLCNRRGFMTLGEQQLRVARRLGAGINLAFVDVDSLKFINDHFGHSEGDRVLKVVAAILKKAFHRTSDLLARIGGDEFAALWIVHRPRSTDTVRARLKSALDAYLTSEKPPYRLSLSIGLCQYLPDFSDPLTEMLSEGDQRMYEEKRRSKPNIA